MVQVVTLTMVREATLTIVKLWFDAACVVVLRCFWSYRGARSTSSSRSPACNSHCEVAICVFCRKASIASLPFLVLNSLLKDNVNPKAFSISFLSFL
jgi:hypothetical protein